MEEISDNIIKESSFTKNQIDESSHKDNEDLFENRTKLNDRNEEIKVKKVKNKGDSEGLNESQSNEEKSNEEPKENKTDNGKTILKLKNVTNEKKDYRITRKILEDEKSKSPSSSSSSSPSISPSSHFTSESPSHSPSPSNLPTLSPSKSLEQSLLDYEEIINEINMKEEEVKAKMEEKKLNELKNNHEIIRIKPRKEGNEEIIENNKNSNNNHTNIASKKNNSKINEGDDMKLTNKLHHKRKYRQDNKPYFHNHYDNVIRIVEVEDEEIKHDLEEKQKKKDIERKRNNKLMRREMEEIDTKEKEKNNINNEVNHSHYFENTELNKKNSNKIKDEKLIIRTSSNLIKSNAKEIKKIRIKKRNNTNYLHKKEIKNGNIEHESKKHEKINDKINGQAGEEHYNRQKRIIRDEGILDTSSSPIISQSSQNLPSSNINNASDLLISSSSPTVFSSESANIETNNNNISPTIPPYIESSSSSTTISVSNSPNISTSNSNFNEDLFKKQIDSIIYDEVSTNLNYETIEKYTLVIRREVLPGKTRAQITVNSSVPGPALYVQLGNAIEVTVINEMEDEVTAIHWHGMRLMHEPYMDGVINITQCPIPAKYPRGTGYEGDNRMIYKFIPTHAGTFWYHGHYNSQYPDGLYGFLVVTSEGERESLASKGVKYNTDNPNFCFAVADYYEAPMKDLVKLFMTNSPFKDQTNNETQTGGRTTETTPGGVPITGGIGTVTSGTTPGGVKITGDRPGLNPNSTSPLRFLEENKNNNHHIHFIKGLSDVPASSLPSLPKNSTISSFQTTDDIPLYLRNLPRQQPGVEFIQDSITVNNLFSNQLHLIDINKEESIRLRLLNAAAFGTYEFSIDGIPLKLIEVDGIVIEPMIVNKVRLYVGQRASVVVSWEEMMLKYGKKLPDKVEIEENLREEEKRRIIKKRIKEKEKIKKQRLNGNIENDEDGYDEDDLEDFSQNYYDDYFNYQKNKTMKGITKNLMKKNNKIFASPSVFFRVKLDEKMYSLYDPAKPNKNLIGYVGQKPLDSTWNALFIFRRNRRISEIYEYDEEVEMKGNNERNLLSYGDLEEEYVRNLQNTDDITEENIFLSYPTYNQSDLPKLSQFSPALGANMLDALPLQPQDIPNPTLLMTLTTEFYLDVNNHVKGSINGDTFSPLVKIRKLINENNVISSISSLSSTTSSTSSLSSVNSHADLPNNNSTNYLLPQDHISYYLPAAPLLYQYVNGIKNNESQLKIARRNIKKTNKNGAVGGTGLNSRKLTHFEDDDEEILRLPTCLANIKRNEEAYGRNNERRKLQSIPTDSSNIPSNTTSGSPLSSIPTTIPSSTSFPTNTTTAIKKNISATSSINNISSSSLDDFFAPDTLPWTPNFVTDTNDYNLNSNKSLANPYALYEIKGSGSNPFVLPYMQVVDIFINSSCCGYHPFHLHGHHFWIIETSDEPNLGEKLVEIQKKRERDRYIKRLKVKRLRQRKKQLKILREFERSKRNSPPITISTTSPSSNIISATPTSSPISYSSSNTPSFFSSIPPPPSAINFNSRSLQSSSQLNDGNEITLFNNTNLPEQISPPPIAFPIPFPTSSSTLQPSISTSSNIIENNLLFDDDDGFNIYAYDDFFDERKGELAELEREVNQDTDDDDYFYEDQDENEVLDGIDLDDSYLNITYSPMTLTPNYPYRDIIVLPHGGWARVRFVSDNPGVWLLHCHVHWHMELGLSALVVEAPYRLSLQNPPIGTTTNSALRKLESEVENENLIDPTEYQKDLYFNRLYKPILPKNYNKMQNDLDERIVDEVEVEDEDEIEYLYSNERKFKPLRSFFNGKVKDYCKNEEISYKFPYDEVELPPLSIFDLEQEDTFSNFASFNSDGSNSTRRSLQYYGEGDINQWSIPFSHFKMCFVPLPYTSMVASSYGITKNNHEEIIFSNKSSLFSSDSTNPYRMLRNRIVYKERKYEYKPKIKNSLEISVNSSLSSSLSSSPLSSSTVSSSNLNSPINTSSSIFFSIFSSSFLSYFLTFFFILVSLSIFLYFKNKKNKKINKMKLNNIKNKDQEVEDKISLPKSPNL